MAAFTQSWDDPVNPIRNEMVFANRNKEYGAYVIRRNYNKRVVMALLIALTVVILSVVIR
jgi:protein TonB